MADDLLGIGEAATELSKGATSLLKTLCGPAAEEAGQILADRVRYWRWKNALSIMEQANKTLIEKGITPRPIPLKTLMPIMEGISVEDESENLKAKWVNLISNAAAGKSIHPKYIKLFSELDSTDALVLDTAFDLHRSQEDDLIRKYFNFSHYSTTELERDDYDISLECPGNYLGDFAVVCYVGYLKDIQKKELDYETVAESVSYLKRLNLMAGNVEAEFSGGMYYSQPRLTTFGLGFLSLVSEAD